MFILNDKLYGVEECHVGMKSGIDINVSDNLQCRTCVRVRVED